MSFDSIVDDYVKFKKQATEADKEAKKLATDIKKYLTEHDMKHYDTADSSVSIQIRSSTSFDEENLIEYLKVSGLSRGIVKKKEYIDYDSLESAIYRGKLSEETVKELDKFKVVKETQALVIGR